MDVRYRIIESGERSHRDGLSRDDEDNVILDCTGKYFVPVGLLAFTEQNPSFEVTWLEESAQSFVKMAWDELKCDCDFRYFDGMPVAGTYDSKRNELDVYVGSSTEWYTSAFRLKFPKKDDVIIPSIGVYMREDSEEDELGQPNVLTLWDIDASKLDTRSYIASNIRVIRRRVLRVRDLK